MSIFNDLHASLHQMVAIKNGTLAPAAVTRVAIPDAKTIRLRHGLSQQEFAVVLGVSRSVLKSWEQRQRLPNPTALKLLRLIDNHPELIRELAADD